MFFAVKIDGEAYELPKLTLGEARILKREFGLTDIGSFAPGDPDQLVGLLFLCLRRRRPTATTEELLAEVEALDIEAFEPADDEEAAPAADDPTPAGAAGNGS